MSWFSTEEAATRLITAAIYARTDCPECGGAIMISGLRAELFCKACKSTITVSKEFWSGLFFRLHCAVPGRTAVALALAGAVTSELPIYARFAAEHPSCVLCRAPLRLDLRPVGTEGPTPCSGCGHATPSYPAPPWLRAEYPDVQQFFEPFVAPPALAVRARAVSFACPECGANLKLTEATPRVVDCQYCNHALFLPADLWHAMHPVEKRRPWWVAFLR